MSAFDPKRTSGHRDQKAAKVKAICGTYSREEAEKKVADVRAFAAEHKHPLQCIFEQED
jgi:ATP-dependent Clp protease adapter protein ClpS